MILMKRRDIAFGDICVSITEQLNPEADTASVQQTSISHVSVPIPPDSASSDLTGLVLWPDVPEILCRALIKTGLVHSKRVLELVISKILILSP
jgi:hypothetical protein